MAKKVVNKKSNGTKNKKAVPKGKKITNEKKISPTTKVDKKVKPKNNKSKGSMKNKVLIILMSLGILMLTVILFFAVYIIVTSPIFDTNKLYNKDASIFYDKNGVEIAIVGSENREIVKYNEIPQVLIDAIVATEDSRFFQHNGFDIARFAKATVGQLTGNSSAGGASTLTMQVNKNTYSGTESKGFSGVTRKFTDIYMSIFKIEKSYTKEEIIEFYVNAPWLAPQSFGVEQASKTLFGKSVGNLNLAEAALIAGLFQNPILYNPFIRPELSEARRDLVLTLMVRHGYISEEQRAEAAAISVESLLVDSKPQIQNEYQPFIDTVVEEIIDRLGNEHNPYLVPMKVYTTMDMEAQKVVNSVQNGEHYKFDKYKYEDKVQMAVAVTDVKDGSISAVGNGRNVTGERQFNRATQMFRHPGSTAKPIFAYGPLLEYENASTYSLFLDEQWKYSNGSPFKNSDNTYRGLMTMRTALVSSRNIPAVQAFQQVSDNNIAEFAHNLGMNYGDTLFESAAIGGFDGSSPLELSAAYAAFGRGGYYIEPYSFTKIEYIENDNVYEHKPIKEKVMSSETAYMINSMLTTAGASGVGGNFKISGTDVAAKTGTSTVDSAFIKKLGIPSDTSRDNWSIVYTPDYSISLWYGVDNVTSTSYTRTMNAHYARASIMVPLAKGILKPNAKFSGSSGVVRVAVEYETFPPQAPSAHTPKDLIVNEYFRKGTEPSEQSKRFSELSNPTGGSYTTNGSGVTISWNAIANPEAIDANALADHFNEYYGDYAQKYYNRRVEYNNANIGTLGYHVYLKDASGSLISLGYTNTTNFTYNGAIGVDYTFVVKSSYSIFKANMSSGLEISTNSSSSSTISVTLNGNDTVCLTKAASGNYIDPNASNPLTVFDSMGSDITSLATINSTYYKGNAVIPQIPLNIVDNYKITYSATYNSMNKSATRNIVICENGCNPDNTCI